MSVRANHDPKFFRRYLFIAVGCLAFAIWCFYDALIGYPAEFERAYTYWQESTASKNYEGMERSKWREVTAAKGWPTEAPKKPDEIKKSINQQYLMAICCIIIGVPCLLMWFKSRGSWVEGDGQTLTTHKGLSIPYASIKKLNKTKWEKKGITIIHYDSQGSAKKFAFDDFKYERAPMGEILEQIESGLTDEQIEGGDRQTVINERVEKAKQEKAAKEAALTAQLKSDEGVKETD